MKVLWATRLRGFFRHMSQQMTGVDFLEKEGYYETPSLLTKLKSRVIRLPVLDPAGVFQVVNAKGHDCDAYGSFNRFLDADKPYFLYLENPTALYHYTLGRISYRAGRDKFQNCLNSPNLRYIVCMSDACKDTFARINMPVPAHVKMKTIYPFVPDNPHIDLDKVRQKSKGEYLECLYCVQGIRFISKGGLEVLTAVERLRKQGCKIRLTVITKLSDLDKAVRERLNNCQGIVVHDFDYSYEEMEKVYAKANVLLQPSSDDSFGLTVLEAMKGGCAVIASKMYAFPEMVADGINGYLLEPKWRFFDEENIPNPSVWNHRKRTIYHRRESETLVAQLEEAISKLCGDRELLEELSLNSLECAGGKFGESRICAQWDDVWEELGNIKEHETGSVISNPASR